MEADALALVATFGAAFAIGSCYCVMNAQDNNAMVSMVAHGASAAGARCAVKGDSELCRTLIIKGDAK